MLYIFCFLTNFDENQIIESAACKVKITCGFILAAAATLKQLGKQDGLSCPGLTLTEEG